MAAFLERRNVNDTAKQSATAGRSHQASQAHSDVGLTLTANLTDLPISPRDFCP